MFNLICHGNHYILVQNFSQVDFHLFLLYSWHSVSIINFSMICKTAMKALEKNIINLYGEKGQQWLADLPNLIAQVGTVYGLSNLNPVKDLSYNYVFSGFRGNQPIILKLGPDIDGLKQEARALKAFLGFGVVNVIAEKDGLLLQIRVISGISLKSYFPTKDNEAISIAINIMNRLHKAPIPCAHSFPNIKDWLAVLDKDWGIPTKYIQKARVLRDNLLKTSENEVLLHGDLHHDNILQNGDDWLVIDPKGVIGEPAYEVGAFIRNPIPELLKHGNVQAIIDNRIMRFAEMLKLPERRILDWCFVQAVLSWVWALEDGSDAIYFKQIVELIESN
jgi:streptomycin 6-kinase